MFKLAVVIGRFQPFHNGHLHLIREAHKVAEQVLILVGSAHSPRSLRNPWNFEERRDMIINSVTEDGLWPHYPRDTFVISGLMDYFYNDEAWLEEANRIIDTFYWNKDQICIVGHDKDASSYYMKMFPQYKVVNIDNHEKINATNIREQYFLMKPSTKDYSSLLPEGTLEILAKDSGRMVSQLVEEGEYITEYKKSWEGTPYAPIFVTVDSIVVCSGHVLVVERGEFPGKGLLALPGGFINPDEKLLDAALRELKEETRVKMPLKAIKGALQAQHVFDHPDRSMRGRTISHGFFFHLEPGVLPEVRGADDAAKAFWKPLSELDRREFFEDHYHIIRYFV